MSSKSKKFILFIVEGITEETSLALILSQIIQSNTIRFHIINYDITSDLYTNSSNAIKKVHEQIKDFLKKSFLKEQDILKIIHLVDTDGAFIDSNNIV